MSIVSCKQLTKVYKDKRALKDVTFTIEKQGCVGFLGNNGAGKTTTMRILTGLTMQERVHEMGGTMHLHSAPGEGTGIDIWLPVMTNERGSDPDGGSH
ncbi:ATP-binding cassette domain-containing protein [Paenibacillus darwinianus]|uniref:ATP-binding cassette domain-containing protein n=1 Tax=Paenibacillus darwinianus TaxID=1380763 RepID=UPI0009DF5BE3|nr:ATP-binding cassette domain-containing protein [Paenibacillus darwinianus]